MKRKDHVRVGFFVLGSAVVFVALIVFAIGSRIGKKETSYFIHFSETVKGMVTGSPVNFQGVRIGRVRDMRFVSGRTEVEIAVDPTKAPIQASTVASLDRAWVTGQVTIELTGWNEHGEVLPEYGLIAAELSPGAKVLQSMPEVISNMTEIFGEFSRVAQRIGDLLDEDSPIITESVALLREARQTSTHLRETTLPGVETAFATIQKLEPEMRRVLASLDGAAGSLDRFVGDEDARRAVSEAVAFVERAKDALPDLVRLSREVETFLRGNRTELRTALANLASGMRDFQEFARILQRAPNSLLFGYRKSDAPPPNPPHAAPEGRE
ncbi:MAG: MCE family protein [Planctomycetes bacterium]|nr:MCE family protein [Planctomycetota bacterium]